MRRIWAFGVIVLTTVNLPLVASPAFAHAPDGATTYPLGWQEQVVNMYFSGNPNWFLSLPGIADRVIEGMVTWNNSPASLHFHNAGSLAGLSETSCNSPNVNGIFWTVLDGAGGFAGEVRACHYLYPNPGGRIYSVRIILDGNEPTWNARPGPAAAGELDLRSVATHELGHATGMFLSNNLHWEDLNGRLCPLSASRETMCDTIPLGTSYMRTLATHDSHTADLRY